MSERRTRRQAALAAANETPTKSDAHGDMNGNSDDHVSTMPTKHAGPTENIFLFWPNLIGYFRIVLAVASLYYMPLHPRTCSLLYSISCLLDALDGYAARYFHQSTRFGAVLDMVTDRCTTSCLLVFLSSAFPRWAIVFQGLISLDFASHYIHMYATLAMGGSAESHKNVDKSRSWLLNLYYTNKLLKSVGESKAAAIQSGAQVNSSIISQLFTNPYSAAALEMARANKMDSTWPWILAGVSAPVMIIKNVLNIVQLVKASKWLAEGDVEQRRMVASAKAKKGRKAN
ncbi:hypothetical protein O1611_g1105 [Lasiodiplodia mahajangana]|uniref:Uncharacterized protein n=1 Tax=Lasiodiplodia mahajangana TaxID=1108764 RepID=A0ACC2JYG9_9PEZI|nr:hypothetical protein O1611_g1105 [Lasiodiplodia mahajangana]